MTEIKTFIVDAFTNEKFKGNQAGICLLDFPVENDLMQKIASELNLSETGFIFNKGDNTYSIRYFSPKTEIPLCGHATLSAAKVIMDELGENDVTFITGQNLVLKTRKLRGNISMDFPLYETHLFEVSEETLKSLGVPVAIETRFAPDTNMVLLEIESSDQLKKMSPDFIKLEKSINNIDGIIVTAKSNDGDYDFHSRYFWPWVGTNEDPVTGAAHTVLANYWSKKLNKMKLRAYQCSKRGGFMDLEILENGRLNISSNAVIILKGDLKV